jgi:hypothetical protein
MPHSTKKKNPVKMKQLEQDPCANCLYGKKREQHNVPVRVKNFNRVTPKEAFGPKVKSNKSKPKVSDAKK